MSAPPRASTMASLAVITGVLTMMGGIKIVALRYQWISMA
jgi:hypothetical protein